MSILSDAQIIALWINEGGSISSAPDALARALSESSGNTDATSSNPDGGTNVGLYQLDTRGVGAGNTVAQLQNPYINTQITIKATKNGTDWAEWADNWQNFIGQAQTAVSSFTNTAANIQKLLAGVTTTGGGGAGATPPPPPTDSGGGGGGSWLSFLTDPIHAASDLLKLVEFLINPISWLRIIAGFAGFFLLFAGLFVMAKAA